MSINIGGEVSVKYNVEPIEGIVRKRFRGGRFSNGEDHFLIEDESGNFYLIEDYRLKPKPRWERVEGKVRIVHAMTGEATSEPSTHRYAVQEGLDNGRFYIERLVEDES